MKLYLELGFEDDQGKEQHLLRFSQDISEGAVSNFVEFVMKYLKDLV